MSFKELLDAIAGENPRAAERRRDVEGQVPDYVHTHEGGADSDGVPNLEFGQYADGEWIAGQEREWPATQDMDQLGRMWAAGMVEILRTVVERLVGIQVEQPDTWTVQTVALTDGSPVRVLAANPNRIRAEVHRVTSGEVVYVASTEGEANGDHTRGLVSATRPFETDALDDVWAVAVGADHSVAVYQWFRSGLAPGHATRHGG